MQLDLLLKYFNKYFMAHSCGLVMFQPNGNVCKPWKPLIFGKQLGYVYVMLHLKLSSDCAEMEDLKEFFVLPEDMHS